MNLSNPTKRAPASQLSGLLRGALAPEPTRPRCARRHRDLTLVGGSTEIPLARRQGLLLPPVQSSICLLGPGRAHPTAPLRPCGPAWAAPPYTSWRCLKTALRYTAVRRQWGAAIHASVELRACPGPPHFPLAPPAHGPSPVPPAAFGVRCPSGNGSREMKSNVINYYFYSVFMDGWK